MTKPERIQLSSIIMKLLAQGLTPLQVADRLNISREFIYKVRRKGKQ